MCGIIETNEACSNIENSIIYSEVTTSKERVGGIFSNNSGTITGCINNGKVTKTVTSGSVYAGCIVSISLSTSR